MKRYSLILGGIIAAGTLWAAEPAGPRISSPVLGYVFDGTAKSIRAISGVPGAASLGEPVSFSSGLAGAWVHSAARVAIAVTKENELALLSWGPAAHAVKLESALGSLSMVSFSRNGEFAAISDGAAVEVWSTGATPSRVKHYHAGATISAVAAANNGDTVVADGGTLLRVAGGDPQIVASGGTWTALTFIGEDVIAADAAHNELLRLSTDGARAVIAALPEAVHAIASLDGDTLAVAHDSGLFVVSASGAAPVACDCQPRGLDELLGAVSVRGTSFLLDAAGGPRLTLLPNWIGGGNQ